MKILKVIFFAVVATAVCLTGCANYRIGSTLPPSLRSVYVSPFINKTVEPNIETKIASSTRREFQRDGQLKVVEANEADMELAVVLLSYEVESLLYEKNNPGTTRRYRARITCHVDAKDNKTGETVVAGNVTGETTFPAVGDVVTARRNALDDVSKDLSRKIVDSVINAW